VLGVHEINSQSNGTLQLQVYPNPNNGNFAIQFNLKTNADVKISIHDSIGRLVDDVTLNHLPAGQNFYSKQISSMISGGVYLVQIETPSEKATQKIIIE